MDKLSKREEFSIEELDLFNRYFKNGWTEFTLFAKIHDINPRRSLESVTRHLRRMKASGFKRVREQALESMRIGFWDIETSNLNANFGYMISWVIAPAHGRKYAHASITSKDVMSGDYDKRILRELMEEMKKYDILVTHYGGMARGRFDTHFTTTRAFIHRIEDELPKKGELYIMDTYDIAKTKLRLNSNRLDAIGEALGVKVRKTRLSPILWIDAAHGKQSAVDYVLNHNICDVFLLRGIWERLAKINTQPLRSI